MTKSWLRILRYNFSSALTKKCWTYQDIARRALIKRRGPGISPGYFHRKIEEQENQKKPLAIWSPAYLLYLPGNLKSYWQPCLAPFLVP